MKTRFRAPGLKWRTGRLDVGIVRSHQRHQRMCFTITSPDGKSVAFEIEDADIYRLANRIVDEIEVVELERKRQR